MSATEKKAGLLQWLDDRIGWSAVREFLSHKTVPMHRYSVFYYLGGMTLFFFLVQVCTGVLLMLYYRPSADEAFESIEFLVTSVPFGWLVRSIHAWSAKDGSNNMSTCRRATRRSSRRPAATSDQ